MNKELKKEEQVGKEVKTSKKVIRPQKAFEKAKLVVKYCMSALVLRLGSWPAPPSLAALETQVLMQLQHHSRHKLTLGNA